MFSSTLEIKKIIQSCTLPPQCDFVSPDTTLLYANDTDFKNVFDQVQNEIGCSAIEIDLFTYDESDPSYESDELGSTRWARDFITSKTQQEIYVMNRIPVRENDNTAILRYNSNMALSIDANFENNFAFDSADFTYKLTNIISAGGNIFHCVNVCGESYAIVGEAALTSQKKIDHISWKFWGQMMRENPKTGSKSKNKYHFPPNVDGGELIIEERKRNKKILKTQLGKNTSVVIVPNAFSWGHIDVEMGVLPNGVVLLHSHSKTLQLLERHKEKIPNYDKIFENTKNLEITSRILFEKTKRKLEKRKFIVIELCGLITETNDHDGIIAYGLNSLVGVDQSGQIIYTLLRDNPEWYLDYLKNELLKCGVSRFYYSSNQNALQILREDGGSIRCQHNTIPNDVLLINPKKRPPGKISDDDLPAVKKIKLSLP